jgi:hypothetical protein
MWPFFRNKKRDYNQTTEPVEQETRRHRLTLEQLMEDLGDVSDLRNNDAALKFWLPEPAELAVKELAKHYEMNMSRWLRNFLVVHCYGLYVFEWINERYPNYFKYDQSGIMFSRRSEEPPPGKVRITTYWVPELGKNIKPVKLWVPSRLKEDLGLLAEHTGITTSNYVREITIARMLGHGTLPMRPKMLEVESTEAAEDWNEGREVPWQEVSEDEYSHYDVGKTDNEWVDQGQVPAKQDKPSN